MFSNIKTFTFVFFFTAVGHVTGVFQMIERNINIAQQQSNILAFINQEELEYKYETTEAEKKITIIEDKISADKLSTPINKAEIVKIKKYYFLFKFSDGSYELRTGGSPSWRYNNPGKLLYGNFTQQLGAIGKDGRLAIFPTYIEGRDALEIYLFQSDFGYKEKNITEAIKQFAPSKDGYNPTTYTDSIIKKIKISKTKKLGDYNVDEREALLDAIQSIEGFITGNVMKFKNAKDFDTNGY